ncbi:MAG TPA: hypothetical protein VHS78_07180 [Candidatus Elarobacter sp.]|nr:hypothetical protein [Candidatus Elarobacter sp.]
MQRKDAEIARMPQSANGGYCIGSEYFAYYDQATYFSETPDSPGATFTLQVAVPSYDQGGINVTHHTYVYSPFGYSWDSGTETDYFNGYTQVQTAVALDTDWGKLQLWYYATDANNVSWDGEGVKDSCRRTL